MVIQRIQTVFLLLAAALMVCVALLLPTVIVSAPGFQPETFYPIDTPQVFILQMLTALLALIAIFLYKALPTQMRVTRVVIVLTLVAAALQGYTSTCAGEYAKANLLAPGIMYAAALVLEFLALKGMRSDYRLLRESTRLR